MDSTKNGTGLIRFIGLVVLGALLIFNPITLGVVAGIVSTQSFQNEGRDSVREQVFMTSCQQYKDASVWDRWTSYYGWKMGWCGDYLDRM